MRNDLTDLTVVLDRSGSMQSCKNDAEGGLNHFIEEQKKHEGDATFTLVQFDTEYEFVHKAIPIGEVPKCSLVPRGGTALLDAVGRAINETGERLSKVDDANRPGLVVFVIVTDGEENSSHEFTKAQVKEMIERQQSEYQWQFTFLGANQDAFHEAQGLGILRAATAQYDQGQEQMAFVATAANVSRMRTSTKKGESVHNLYSDSERASMKSS